MKEELGGFCSFQDGNENRGQLFALTRVLPNARPFGLPVYVARVDSASSPSLTLLGLPIHVARIPAAPFPLAPFLSQWSEFSRADDPGLHEQFQPVGALTRCLPSSSPATSRVLP